MSCFTESIVEYAALDWLASLGYRLANMIEYRRKQFALDRGMGDR
jgi:hypothetical protein